jgi:hypothetical protein
MCTSYAAHLALAYSLVSECDQVWRLARVLHGWHIVRRAMVSYGATARLSNRGETEVLPQHVFRALRAEMRRNLVLGIYAHLICLKTPTKPSAFVFFPSGNASPAWNP